MKPKVAFIGTGGTIASVGAGPLDLQDYGATGKAPIAQSFVLVDFYLKRMPSGRHGFAGAEPAATCTSSRRQRARFVNFR